MRDCGRLKKKLLLKTKYRLKGFDVNTQNNRTDDNTTTHRAISAILKEDKDASDAVGVLVACAIPWLLFLSSQIDGILPDLTLPVVV